MTSFYAKNTSCIVGVRPRVAGFRLQRLRGKRLRRLLIGEAAEVAAVVVAGRGEPAETARLERFPIPVRSSRPDLMRIGLGGEGMFATLATRMRGPDMHVAAKWVVKVIRKR
jgi:hypothetical protein